MGLQLSNCMSPKDTVYTNNQIHAYQNPNKLTFQPLKKQPLSKPQRNQLLAMIYRKNVILVQLFSYYKLLEPLGRTGQTRLQKTKTQLPYGPASSLLGKYQKQKPDYGKTTHAGSHVHAVLV